MILPIVAYGHSTLRKESGKIDPDYPGLKDLIDNMFETMYSSSGVGLAAPQVNRSIRLIVIDASPYSEEYPDAEGIKKVLINPWIVDESGDEWSFNEGCLSLPEIREDVVRKPIVRLQYQDEDFNSYEEEFSGLLARITQHEYDHLEGILFVDRINSLRKRLLKRRLNDISNGNIKPGYKMIFPGKAKKVTK